VDPSGDSSPAIPSSRIEASRGREGGQEDESVTQPNKVPPHFLLLLIIIIIILIIVIIIITIITTTINRVLTPRGHPAGRCRFMTRSARRRRPRGT
jgi:hypothetical protein